MNQIVTPELFAELSEEQRLEIVNTAKSLLKNLRDDKAKKIEEEKEQRKAEAKKNREEIVAFGKDNGIEVPESVSKLEYTEIKVKDKITARKVYVIFKLDGSSTTLELSVKTKDLTDEQISEEVNKKKVLILKKASDIAD